MIMVERAKIPSCKDNLILLSLHGEEHHVLGIESKTLCKYSITELYPQPNGSRLLIVFLKTEHIFITGVSTNDNDAKSSQKML